MQVGEPSLESDNTPGSLGTAPFAKGQLVRWKGRTSLSQHMVRDVKPLRIDGEIGWYVQVETAGYNPASMFEAVEQQ